MGKKAGSDNSKRRRVEKQELERMFQEMQKISYIKPQDIPNIDLYMDQVTTFMDQYLEGTKRYSEDKLLTKTMINNYTKNDLLPSPQKKKYSKDHLILLIFIYYLKNILSITDIQSVLHPLTELFFDGHGSIRLEEIYETIFAMEWKQSFYVAKDLLMKQAAAEQTFSQVKDEGEREYLKKFAYACLLSYDIYLKRQMLERLIDGDYAPKGEQASKEEEKEHSKERSKEYSREHSEEKPKEQSKEKPKKKGAPKSESPRRPEPGSRND